MDKQAAPGFENSITRLPIPGIGEINNRRFVTAVLAGLIGGAGVSSAANLLRSFREMRKPKSEGTDDETIVLTLPAKAAADGYTGMRDAKPGETKVTANGSQQRREDGKYGKGLGVKKPAKDAVKCAEGNPGPNTVGTVVANTLGLAAGGLLSYEVVSRLFDAMNERRLKRKLEAAQQAYVNAMTGASKRAEAVLKVLDPVEHVILKAPLEKDAALSDLFPDAATNAIRYPAAAYILALLAGTGATAYVTKKVMDREFPEEKLKKDINKPTRIVFRVADSRPSLVEGAAGQEKTASAETCAALTALLPIYMDVVEGQPNRTLAAPYVKIAEAAGTDAVGLMKLAATDLSGVYGAVLKDPKALWEILKGTRFGLDFSEQNVANILRDKRPGTYRQAVDAMIDAQFAGGPNDGLFRRGWNAIAKATTKGFANMGGRDWLVRQGLKTAETKEAGVADLVRAAVSGVGKGKNRYLSLLRGGNVSRFGSHIDKVKHHEQYLDMMGREAWQNMKAVHNSNPAIREVFDMRGWSDDIGRAHPSKLAKLEAYLSGKLPKNENDEIRRLLDLEQRYHGISNRFSDRRDYIKQYGREFQKRLADEIRKVRVARIGTAGAGLATLGGTGYALLGSGKSDDAKKTASVQDLVQNAFKSETPDDKETEPVDEKAVLAKVRKNLKGKRRVSVEAADPRAAAYVKGNKELIQKLLARLNAQGAL